VRRNDTNCVSKTDHGGEAGSKTVPSDQDQEGANHDHRLNVRRGDDLWTERLHAASNVVEAVQAQSKNENCAGPDKNSRPLCTRTAIRL